MSFRPINLAVNGTPSDKYALVTAAPSFSWGIESDTNERICTYRICVYDGEESLWDSGKRDVTESSVKYAGKKLTPGKLHRTKSNTPERS